MFSFCSPTLLCRHWGLDANLPSKKMGLRHTVHRERAVDRCHPGRVVFTLKLYTLTIATIFPLTRPRFRCITVAGRQLPKGRKGPETKSWEVYGRTAEHTTAAASTEGLFVSPGHRRQTLSRPQRESQEFPTGSRTYGAKSALDIRKPRKSGRYPLFVPFPEPQLSQHLKSSRLRARPGLPANPIPAVASRANPSPARRHGRPRANPLPQKAAQ